MGVLPYVGILKLGKPDLTEDDVPGGNGVQSSADNWALIGVRDLINRGGLDLDTSSNSEKHERDFNDITDMLK